MYRNALIACSFYLAATLLSGCANQQNVGSISQTQETTPFQIQEAMAVLYLFNDSGWTLLSGNQDVTDNGKTIASLHRQTYTRIIITPGPHLLRPDPFL